MKIDVYKEFNNDLESIWVKFEKDAVMTPFQSYAWLSHWQKTIGKPRHAIEPQIVIIKDPEQTLAICPFGIRRTNGFRVLEWLGGIHADYMSPLLSQNWNVQKKDFELIWSKILNNLVAFDVLYLKRQPEILDSIENPFIKNFSVKQSDVSYQATLDGDWQEYYNSRVNKKLRADSRRNYRRLNEIGKVSFIIADSKLEARTIIQNMILQKSQRYRNTGVRDMLSIPEHRAFYMMLPDLAEEKGLVLHCAALKVRHKMIATHVGIIHKDRFFYLMPAFESGEWQRYSPGRLLLEHLIKESFGAKLKLFDFTVGAESYKDKWCDKEEKIYEYLKPCNTTGYFYIIWEYIKKNIILSKIGSKYLRKLRIKVS